MSDVSAITKTVFNDVAKPAELVEESTTGLSADFETFLKLLTTQLKSQDPLQPMESTEFVAQLAQFSAVEQQVQTNDKLDTLVASLSASNAGVLADWLGREVRAPVKAPFDGAPISAFPPAPETEATAAALVVRDADGVQVAELPFAPGAASVSWDGRRSDGTDAKAGFYRFEARYTDAKGVVVVKDAEVFAQVIEARAGEDGPKLVLASGEEVAADDVEAVRLGAARREAVVGAGDGAKADPVAEAPATPPEDDQTIL